MEHEETLNLLFGENTDGKTGLDKLKQEIEYDNLPDSHKGTLTDNQKEIEQITKETNEVIKDEIEEITKSTEVKDVNPFDTEITKNTSTLDETEITKNTESLDETEIVENIKQNTEETISSHNSIKVLEEKEITKNTKELKEDPEGTISSHNFENEILN